MSQEDTCSFFGCGNKATEECPECEEKLCLDHKLLHGHPKQLDIKYMGQPEWKTVGSIFIPDDKTESFSSLLSFHRTYSTDKIRALKVFSNMSSIMIEKYLASEKEKFRNKVDAKLSKEEKEEYDLDLSLDILSLPVNPERRHIIQNPMIARLFAEDTERYNHREHIRRASKEMVLVYLVIIFEEFLSNLLSSLFSKRHDTLKDSDKHVLFKDAVEYTDMNELVKTMSKREAKGIVDLEIEELGKRLETRFHLYLNKRDDWPKFKEFFYRRHIVVHNYGVPDSTYIEKTKFKGEKNLWLEIDNTYINEAFNTFQDYADEIANFFHKKYAHEEPKPT